MKKVAVLTFDGFNEVDSFLALNILNRLPEEEIRAEITSPTETVVSMNGIRIEAQRSLEYANEADVVLIGSGRKTRQIANDISIMSRLSFDLSRQLICSQCSGVMILDKMELLEGCSVCTDNGTRETMIEAGYNVLETSFSRVGNVAMAGGCLAAHYLAGWIAHELLGPEAMETALSYAVPVGEESEYISRVKKIIGPYI